MFDIRDCRQRFRYLRGLGFRGRWLDLTTVYNHYTLEGLVIALGRDAFNSLANFIA